MATAHTRGSFIKFAIVMLFAGAAMTVAVAWGCRWFAQTKHPSIDGTIGWINYRGNDAMSGQYAVAADKRRWFVGRGLPPEERAHYNAAGGRVPPWRDWGVTWILVVPPYDIHDWTPSGTPSDWLPPESLPVPGWSSLPNEALADREALIQLAAGWPMRSFITTHRNANRFTTWHALTTETTGSFYGYLPFAGLPQQILYRPLWLGFAADTLFWALTLGILVAVPGIAWRTARSLRRRATGRCPHCGYIIKATESLTCTECGWINSRLDTRRWARASITGLVIGVILLGTEGTAMVLVVYNPELGEIETAAFAGEIETVRTLLAQPDTPLHGNHPRIQDNKWRDTSMGVVTSTAMQAAIVGHQPRVVELLLDHGGFGVPTGDKAVPLEVLMCAVLATGSPETVIDLIERYDLLRPGRVGHTWFLGQIITDRFGQQRSPVLDHIVQEMAHKDEVFRLIWGAVLQGACADSDLDLVETILNDPRVVASDISALTEFHGYVPVDFITNEINADADQQETIRRRVAAARRMIVFTRHEVVGEPGVWRNCLDGGEMKTLLNKEGPAADAARALLVELALPKGAIEFRTLTFLWSPDILGDGVATDRWKWELLVKYGAHPRYMYPAAVVYPVLEPWVQKSTATELVRFLLDHGVEIPRKAYDLAVPETREVLDAWLAEQGKTVQNLRGS